MDFLAGETGAEGGALTGEEGGLATFRLAVGLGAGGLKKRIVESSS